MVQHHHQAPQHHLQTHAPHQAQQQQQALPHPASLPLTATHTPPQSCCTPQQQVLVHPASLPLTATHASPQSYCAPQQLAQSVPPVSAPACNSQPSQGHQFPVPIPLLSASPPPPTTAPIPSLPSASTSQTTNAPIPLLPSASPPQPTTPDPAPWAVACAQDQVTRAGWRAAAGLASAALRKPSVGRYPEAPTHNGTIPSASTSPHSLVVAAPAAAYPRSMPAHSAAGARGQIISASGECGAHASLPPLPPLLAARLADHLRRKERRQIHPQAGSCSPPSSVASSAADSCHSRPMHRSQIPASSKIQAARPARWRERVQLEAPQTACGSSSEESL